MAIYIKQGETLTEMTEQPYDGEEILQELLADHPHLLGGDQEGDQRNVGFWSSERSASATTPTAAAGGVSTTSSSTRKGYRPSWR